MELANAQAEGSPDQYRSQVKAAERLQSEAWTAYNAAFHAPEADEYRRAGHDLYKRVLEERIRALFMKGDEQNRLLDSRQHA